jgi:predicted RNA-binding protein with PIN domain
MRKFLIDGNNLINYHPKLKRDFEKDKILARDNLIQLINDFMINSKNEATIFFDGFPQSDIKPEMKHSFIKAGNNVFIKYSRNSSADSVLKKIIDQEKNKRILVIVSSDHEVMNYGRINSCLVKSAEEFAKTLEKTRKAENPKFNPTLSSNEIDYWLKVFKER